MDARMFAPVTMIALALTPTPAAAADGAAVWKAQCAKCHGETGAADTSAGQMLKTPALPGNEKVAGMTVADVVAAIRASKKHAGLKLADADLEAAAGYAKELAAKK
jgi:cytochrome c